MSTTANMSTPVTRGELREELEQLETRFDHKFEQLETRFDHKLGQIETRFDHKLELWGGALLARIEAGEQRMIAELARHTRAIQESLSIQLSVIDEKYADLPARVSQLESAILRHDPR